MSNAFAIWILSLMHVLQPAAPWSDGYGETALAIAEASEADPLYAGPHGVERTAAVLVSLSWFESRFDPEAVGDNGHSVCLGQVGTSNLKELGVTKAEMLGDRSVCLRSMLRMMRRSFAVCRGRPMPQSLGWYASGGKTCGGLVKSGHRIDLALRLLRDHPFISAEEDPS